MSSQEEQYLDELNKARLSARQAEIDQEPESKTDNKINLIEAILIIGLVAFLGNDVVDWLWGLIDLGSGGIGLALDWTINTAWNGVTTGIIVFWLYMRGARPNVMQKAIIGAIAALVLDSLPFVSFVPVFTVQTTVTVFVINYSARAAAIMPGTQKAFTIIEGGGKGATQSLRRAA